MSASARYLQIKEIYFEALELPFEQRSFLLDRKCLDQEMREEIELLLKTRAEAREFLVDISAVAVIHESYQKLETSGFIGQLVSKYRILREVGRGGMGLVFLAEREDFHQQAALKVIKRGMDSDAILKRFMHEREILAALNHPFIARLIDGGTTDDGQPYFIMEYVEGIRIDEYCQVNNLSEKEILDLFRKACEAVSFAHQKLIVHRDLKPSNILVTADATPKLLDFGIAKLLNTTESNTTQTNQRVLTPAYASPEQIKGEQVDTTSDVFSLGRILTELLQPVAKSNTKITNSDDPKITNNPLPVLSTDLQAILQTALRNESVRRYSSVEKLAEDIRRYQQGLPVSAQRDTFTYRAKKFVQRNALIVSVTTLFLLISIIGLTLIIGEHNKAQRRFNDVQKLAHTFIFDYNDAVVYFPGSTALRQRMVKDSLEYLDNLSKEAGDDQALQQEIAEAYIKIGDIEGRNGMPSLGDMRGALESYQKAHMILEKLKATDPSPSNTILFDLGEIYERLGESNNIFSGKAAEAAQFYRQSIDIFEELHKAAPEDFEVQAFLGYTHRLLGDTLGVPPAANLGDAQGALEELQKAVVLLSAIPTEKLSEGARRPFGLQFDKKYDLASIYAEIAVAVEAKGDKAAAIDYQRKAVTLLEERLSGEPDNAIVRRNLAVTYGNLGTDLLNAGDANSALLLYQKALTIEESLAAADENNSEAKKDVATGHRNLGKALTAIGDKKGSAENYQKAITIFEGLVAKDPSNAFLRRNLAFTYLKMSQLLSGTDDVNGAINYAQKSVSICAELVAVDSKNATVKNTLAQTYIQLGDCQTLLAARANNSRPQQLEYWREAKDSYQKSLDLWQEMKTQGTLSSADSGKLDEAAQKVSKCALLLQP